MVDTKTLTHGHAGKLKRKLNFAASQLLGKSGRALMPALSYRQYSNKKKMLKPPLHLSRRSRYHSGKMPKAEFASATKPMLLVRILGEGGVLKDENRSDGCS